MRQEHGRLKRKHALPRVERNALRADLVRHADQWRWSSLWRRLHGTPQQRSVLSDWPMPLPRDWLAWLNRAETEAELQALRRSVNRGRPYGSDQWVERVVSKLGLAWSIRPRGRPRKEKADS